MEFKVNSTDFEKLLTKVIPAVPTRTPMPILENFLFEIKDGQLTVFATDLEISLKSSMAIMAESDARIVVPARMTYDVVRSLKDASINFRIAENKQLVMNTENGEYKLSYIDPAEYPSMPVFPPEDEEEDINELTISGGRLRTALENTSFAMSKEEMRPAMMGTLLEFDESGMRFVATDGHRLVNLLYKDIQPGFKAQYIVPEKAISVLTKLVGEKEVKVYLSKTHISFSLDDIELITRLIGQKYPDYRGVIPMENELYMKVKTKDLHNAIKRMMIFSMGQQTRRVKFAIDSNQLVISAEDVDQGTFGKETLYCEYKEDPLEIGFNSAYVNDILNHSGSEEEIFFRLHSPNKAVIVEPVDKKDNAELMMLLMPVRLNT